MKAILLSLLMFTFIPKVYASELKKPLLFSERSILKLRMEAPWARLFIEDATSTPANPASKMMVKISYADVNNNPIDVTAEVKVRGQSSKNECAFLKLKIKLPQQTTASQFAGVKGFKLNTHCDDFQGHTQLGRLANENSTLREGLAYEMGATIGAFISAVRRAQITYIDSETGVTFERFALIIEDSDVTAERFGGQQFESESYPSDVIKTMGWNSLAAVYLFENLVGNWDWHLVIEKRKSETQSMFETRRLWNMKVIVQPNLAELPMPHDFDMASFVSGKHRLTGNMANTLYLKDQPPLTRYLALEILKTRLSIPRKELLAARDAMMAKRADLYKLVSEPFIDKDGVVNARAHLDAFFSLVNGLAMSVPLLTRDEMGFDSPTEPRTLNCHMLKAGSPIEILEIQNSWVNIKYLGLGCNNPSTWIPLSSVEIPQ